jgi:SNF2 family DNA or RNA helicase
MSLVVNLKDKVRTKIYNRGKRYYKQQRIRDYDYSLVTAEEFKLEAQVMGTKKYEVDIKVMISSRDLSFRGECSCPYDWGPICKHQVAVIYKFLTEDYSKLEGKDFQEVNFNKLVELSHQLENDRTVKLKYIIKGLLTDSMVNFKLTFAAEQLTLTQLEGVVSYIHTGGFDSSDFLENKLTIKDKNKLDYLAWEETSKSRTDASFLFPKSRRNFDFLLDLITEREVYLGETDELAQVGEVLYPSVTIGQQNDFIKLEPELDDTSFYTGENICWVVREAVVHPFRQEIAAELPNNIPLTGNRKGKFIFELLPQLREKLEAEVDEELLEYKLVKQEPEIKLSFDYTEGTVTCQAWVRMGDKRYANSEIVGFDLDDKHYQQREDNQKLWQAWNTEEIARLLNFLEEYEFHVQPDKFYIKEQQDIQNFLLDGLTHLPEEWEIETTSAFDELEVMEVELEPEINFTEETDSREDAGINWFEFEVTYKIAGETYSREELQDLLSYNQRGTAYFQQGDKYFVVQKTNQEKQVERLLGQAQDQEDKGYRANRYNLLYYRRVIEEAGIEFDGNQVYDELNQDITKDNLVKEVEVPAEVEDVLRDYQNEGYYWLKFLHKYNFGGVLADDMGLGKTLQTLTLLKSISLAEPAFIVCPRSLIYNWGLEIDKFLPQLDYLVYHGTPEERAEMRGEFRDYQLLITSYSIISRDWEELQEFEFSYCILDEAHHIKNRQTQKAQGVKQIPARHKLALTGTPLENSLKELWSIFDFLMPGYLNNYNQFRKQYLQPINKEEDGEKLVELKDRIAPFILRRTKGEVLSDLPEKLINIHQVEMTKAQEESYKLVLEQVTNELESNVQEKGFNQSQINVLAALTKLRQICDHPQLVIDDPERKLSSAKLAALLEIIEDAIEGGHKLVVFSQFVKMLKLIREELEQKEISFCYLDGSTRNRIEEVNQFNQEPEKKVFLISLKAGGIGLNLTAADIVVHVDPWWNPMVERQASDRVHRIGQENKVMIYKLITAGTVEEKMLKLKQQKKEMFERVIENSDSPLQNISWQDIQELLTYN